MLAAKNGHKNVISILTQRGASLNLVDAVSVMWICYSIKKHKYQHVEHNLVTITISFVL